MMVFSLSFGGPEKADHAMRIKGISGSAQAPFRQAGFLRPFCWWDPKQGNGPDPFVQALFWRSTPLLEQMIVVGSFPAFSPGLGRRVSLLSDPNGLPARGQQIGVFQTGVNDDGRLVRARSADDAQRDAVHLVDHRADLIACL